MYDFVPIHYRQWLRMTKKSGNGQKNGKLSFYPLKLEGRLRIC
jgi:hypothetical protein